MVNVNKPISKNDGTIQKVENRRPRNTELNSSKSATSAITGVSLANIRKLNCSREAVIQELRRWLSEEEAKDYLEAFENETGATVVRLASPEEAAMDGDFWAVKDGKEQLWYRTDGEWYTKDDLDGSCGETDADSSLNCESGSAKVSGTVTIYNDFADLDNDTTERLLRSRIEKAVPGAKVDFEKVNDTDVKVTIDCADADAEKARLAVESSDVAKSVDWNSATAELDSSADTSSESDSSSTTENTTESMNLNSSEEPEGDTDGGDAIGEGSDEVAMITTESGNEVALSDIKIVQNPETNEISLFIKEDEDEEIPEGFVVIATASQPTLPADNTCPECGQDPCVCESVEETDGEEGEGLDSSKKKNELNCSENIKEALADAGDDEHDVLTYVVQCIEYLGKADEVLSKINDEAAPEGSNLREQLSDIDTHEALVAVVEALEDLGLVDEVLNTMAINPLGNEPDIDSNLNCSISEVTVPENFGREKSQLMDLRNIIEGELSDKGYDVSVKELARPNATTMQISFEGGNGNEEVIDRAIEEIVADVANFNSPTSANSSLSEEEPIAEANQEYQVFYVDENGNGIDEPAVIEVPAGLTGIELYEAILDRFDEQYPNCSWETICDMEDNVKMDSSKKSELNSSVHDNPALKVFVDKIKQTAQQVSAVPTMEDGKTGYKIIVRGMESADVEPLAKEMGIKLAGIKPLEGGFAIIVDDVSLNNSTIDPESPDLMNDGMRYRGYFISGSDRIGYVCVSPYGAFSPGVYKTVDEAKEAIDQDMKFRFPEGENNDVDTTLAD